MLDIDIDGVLDIDIDGVLDIDTEGVIEIEGVTEGEGVLDTDGDGVGEGEGHAATVSTLAYPVIGSLTILYTEPNLSI